MTPTTDHHPRFRCYDNQDTDHATADHYTIVMLKRNEHGKYTVMASSTNPNHPQGVWSSDDNISYLYDDEECCKSFGRRIPFNKLPERVQNTVKQYYEVTTP